MNIGSIVVEPVLDGRLLSKLRHSRSRRRTRPSGSQHGMITSMVVRPAGAFLRRTACRRIRCSAASRRSLAAAIDCRSARSGRGGATRDLGAGELRARSSPTSGSRDIAQGRLPDSLTGLGVGGRGGDDVVTTYTPTLGWASTTGARSSERDFPARQPTCITSRRSR
jgi:hypothetical protein